MILFTSDLLAGIHFMINTRGFTLIEMVVYTGITSILMAAVIGFSYQFLDSMSIIQTTASIEETGNFILQKALYDFDHSIPLLPPAVPQALSLTNLIISTSSISFSILDHDFSLTPFIEIER
jgi:type II secretory pathway pseudopilin PulG